jgi:hypothetical protein
LGASDNEWQGFHVGADALYGMGSSNLNTGVANGGAGNYYHDSNADPDIIPVINEVGQGHAKAGNISGGLDGGYDWQLKHLVLGVDLEVTDLSLNETANEFKATDEDSNLEQDTQSLHTDWSVALRPHIGFAFGDFLLEGNAGVSVMHATYTENFADEDWPETEGVSDSRFLVAPVFGVGARYHINPNWVAKLDLSFAKYSPSALGNNSLAYADQAPSTAYANPGNPQGALYHSFDLTVETLAVGLDYQF